MAKKQTKIDELLTRGVEKIYPSREALEKKLNSGQKIRLYCGFDPTAKSLHLGHLIQLRKLAQFQALGHEVIFLIGDFTGMIGDPTDKTETRQKLTRQEVLNNARYYKKQASKILKFSGPNSARLMYNSQWNDKLSFLDLVELASHFTVQQMIIRDMFQERLKKRKPIYLHEFLYPLIQAYDSVAMDVDLEVGGRDQIFNMLCGRDLMKALKNKEKFVLATKLLVSTSGEKMGKSEGNALNLDEEPIQMYGKVMSWSDEFIIPALELCTDVALEEIKEIEAAIRQDRLNPRDAKARLARELVATLHNRKAATEAEKEFERVFQRKEKPTRIPLFKTAKKRYPLLDLLVESRLVSSKSEAKRLIQQKGVKVDGRVMDNWESEINIKDEEVIQVGKRRFIKIKK